jgi:hypothetical protein
LINQADGAMDRSFRTVAERRREHMNDTRNTAIAANIEALASVLSAAFGTATQAREYMTVGQRNAAIGTIMEVEGQLAEPARCSALPSH